MQPGGGPLARVDKELYHLLKCNSSQNGCFSKKCGTNPKQQPPMPQQKVSNHICPLQQILYEEKEEEEDKIMLS